MERTQGFGLIVSLGLIVVVMLAFGASPARAQTVAPGPYYATPSWDQTLPASTRFIVLSNMNSDAVLDRETGLVWEKSPSTSTFNWGQAEFQCIHLSKGNRLGWRQPTLQELESLVDPSVAPPGPTLPAGHPFQNVQSAAYWSASTVFGATSFVWTVDFSNGSISSGTPMGATFRLFVWCVRGGQGVDPQ